MDEALGGEMNEAGRMDGWMASRRRARFEITETGNDTERRVALWMWAGGGGKLEDAQRDVPLEEDSRWLQECEFEVVGLVDPND